MPCALDRTLVHSTGRKNRGATSVKRFALADVALLFCLALPLAALAAEPKPGEIWRESVTAMEFAWVPGGCFHMGCGDWSQDCELYESPPHLVCVDGFWLGRREVTQDQWTRIMGANPSFNKGRGDLPVELVSWHEARDFAARLSDMGGGRFRLPTEAQWEFAARSGGKPELFSGGHDENRVGWHLENSGGRAHPVGQKAPNGLGLFDMTGNVFEWCEDVFDRGFYARSPRDNPLCADPGQTPADWRVRRGGSFGNLARDTRTAMRGKLEPGARDEFTGLRLLRQPDARPPQPQPEGARP